MALIFNAILCNAQAMEATSSRRETPEKQTKVKGII